MSSRENTRDPRRWPYHDSYAYAVGEFENGVSVVVQSLLADKRTFAKTRAYALKTPYHKEIVYVLKSVRV